MTMLDFDSDQFLQLVTDALRAGPESAAWRQAISELMIQDVGGDASANRGAVRMDEYRLLFTARKHLESGKGYRKIHAGPQFTQKVMEAVALESTTGFGRGGSGKILSTTNLIMAGVAILVLGSVAVIGWTVFGGGAHQSLTDLQSQTFSQDVVTATFDGGAMPGWKTIGTWPMSSDGALHPTAAYEDGGYLGCGIVTVAPLPADGPAEIQARLRLPEKGETVMQVFLTDQPEFSASRATSAHELVWSMQPAVGRTKSSGKPEVVLPDGSFAATGQSLANPGDAIVVRLAFNSDYVVAECDGRQLYAGPHQLARNKPRYVGVRFLCGAGEQPAVLSVRVSKG